MKVTKTITLNNGTTIPTIGFGTWELTNAKQAVLWALEVGYRHIDTASIYGTEEAVGQAIHESGIPREEVFVTTKLWNSDQGYDRALPAFHNSLERLGMTYVDLYLIHWPGSDDTEGRHKRADTWRAMEEICETGKARAIGVSNYEIPHLEEMASYAKIPPATDQVEMHPFWFRKQLLDYCQEKGIAVTNYSPLTRKQYLSHEVITAIAKKHGKTNAQVLLRWGLQHGCIVIPKASSKEHIEENIDVYDFELTDDEMRQLDSLNQNQSML